MTQVVSNRTGRETIVKAEGKNTEIKILAKQESERKIATEVEIKFNKEHNFKDNYKIKLQAYESKGAAQSPWDLGTIKDLGTGSFNFNVFGMSLDRVLFRLKVIDENNFVKGEANEIKPTLKDSEDKIKISDNSSTLIPIREDKRINLPFSLDMEPDSSPILLVKAGLNMKQLFKENVQIKVLIYSSIIRQILTTYLADPAYKNCQKKDKFIEKVISNSGLQSEIPNYFREDGKVNEDAIEWIEEVTAGCINMPIIKAGKRIRYLEEFKKICLLQKEIEDEN
jgi:hypothetical protein